MRLLSARPERKAYDEEDRAYFVHICLDEWIPPFLSLEGSTPLSSFQRCRLVNAAQHERPLLCTDFSAMHGYTVYTCYTFQFAQQWSFWNFLTTMTA